MNDLRVRPEAELDVFEAALWYEGEREGLGSIFLDAVRYVLGRIAERPLQFPLVSADIRRAFLHRFRSVSSSWSRAIGRRSSP